MAKPMASARLLLLCVVAGWFIELLGDHIIKPLFGSYVAVHSAQAITYLLLGLLCFTCYKKLKLKSLLILNLMAFIYGVLLLITINDAAYIVLRGFVWHDTINYLFIYRCIEFMILIKAAKDGRFTDWIRNTVAACFFTYSYHINSNTSKVGN